MTMHPPDVTDDDNRVLKFKPRLPTQAPVVLSVSDSDQTSSGARDLSRYEQNKPRPDDYRQRMMANAAAVAFTALLTGMGIWLAVKLTDLRNMQDCVLMGRRDCGNISSPQG
jgi:hypothetical protein